MDDGHAGEVFEYATWVMRDFCQSSSLTSDHFGTVTAWKLKSCRERAFVSFTNVSLYWSLRDSCPRTQTIPPFYHSAIKWKRHAVSHSPIRAGSVLVASASCWLLFAFPSSAASFSNKPTSMPTRTAAVLVGSAQPIHKIDSIGVSRALIRDLAFAIIS